MIRNVVVHINGEQPLSPTSTRRRHPATWSRCTNLRLKNGKRPVFVDEIKSIFFFPYLHIRFLGSPWSDAEAAIRRSLSPSTPTTYVRRRAELSEPEPDLEIDEDFLRRIREV